MTAKQLSAPLPGDVAPETLGCNHKSISPGLDQIQCKSCKRYWSRWHPDYERLLNQPSIVAPEQGDIVLEQNYDRLLNQPSPSTVAPEQGDIVLEQNYDRLLNQPSPSTVAPEQIHWVETYSPSNRKHCTYYRYMWMEGRKLCRIHIPGSAKGISAHFRKQEIERGIAAGWWPTEIEELIKSWRHR